MPSKRMKKPVWAAIGAVFVGSIALIACTTLSKIKKAPVATLSNVQVTAPDAEGATLVFAVGLQNPNEAALEVDAVDYALEVEGKPFATGKIEERTTLPALGQLTVNVPVKVKYKDVFSSVMEFLQTGARKYRITGAAKVGWFSVPFAHSGEVKLQGGL